MIEESLVPSFVIDSEFIFMGEPYPFSMQALKIQSCFINENSNNIIEVDFPVSKEAFASFVDAINFKKFSINSKNAAHLQFLANNFQIESLSSKVSKFMDTCSDVSLVIETLIFKNKLGLETNSEEEKIASRIQDSISSPEFYGIEIEIIDRIIQKSASITSNIVFQIYQNLESFELCSGHIFKYIDVDELSPKIKEPFVKFFFDYLTRNGLLPKNMDKVLSTDQIKKYEREIEKYKKNIHELQNNNENIENKMKTCFEVNSVMNNNIAKLNNKIKLLEKENIDLKDKIEKMILNSLRLKNEKDDLEAQNDGFEKEVMRLEKQNKDIREKNYSLDENVNKLKVENQKLAQINGELNNIKIDNDELIKKNNIYQQEIFKLREQNQVLELKLMKSGQELTKVLEQKTAKSPSPAQNKKTMKPNDNKLNNEITQVPNKTSSEATNITQKQKATTPKAPDRPLASNKNQKNKNEDPPPKKSHVKRSALSYLNPLNMLWRDSSSDSSTVSSI